MKVPRLDGFRFGAVAAGIKVPGKLDVGILTAHKPVACSVLFTQNQLAAAPVWLSRTHLKKSRGLIRGWIVNSGNANAATGKIGDRDALAMCRLAAQHLTAQTSQLLVASTGVIGLPLPMERIENGIRGAAAHLSDNAFLDFADCILTTDKARKVAFRSFGVGKNQVHILGCIKGAGMIAPNMATNLTFVITNAALPQRQLTKFHQEACATTLNAMTIDGDTSTNDTFSLMASGEVPLNTAGKQKQFTAALTDLCNDLTHQLMRGGEGVKHVVRVWVKRAPSSEVAFLLARNVANSPLVKTAIAGADPNWGRIVCAVGNSAARLPSRNISILIGDTCVFKKGVALPASQWENAAHHIMKNPEYDITIDLHGGNQHARVLACDLTHEYVALNADYRS